MRDWQFVEQNALVWEKRRAFSPSPSFQRARMCVQVLGAGQYNGQFAVFDMRQGSNAVDATPIEKSHRHASHVHLCTHAL